MILAMNIWQWGLIALWVGLVPLIGYFALFVDMPMKDAK